MIVLEGALTNSSPDTNAGIVVLDLIKARRPHDVDDEARPGHAHVQHWDQGLPTGQDSGVRASLM